MIAAINVSDGTNAVGIGVLACLISLLCLVLWIREADRNMRVGSDLLAPREAERPVIEPTQPEPFWVFPVATLAEVPLLAALHFVAWERETAGGER